MNKEFEDEIWESFLKTAVIENSQNENRDYPSEQELKKIHIPEHYDLKIRRLIRYYNYQVKVKSVMKYCRKIASIMLLFMGFSFALLLQHNEVRAACKNVIIEIYDRYITLIHTSDLPQGKPFVEVEYIPEGFSIIDSSADGISNYIIYQNSSGDLIELNYDTQKYTSLIDNEHYSILHVKINNVEGTFFESQDNRFMNILIWDTTNNYFKLKSTLGMNEMIKIAENLK